MSEIQSAKLRERWAKVPNDKRTKLMRKLAKKKQAMLSDIERVKHGKKMARAKIALARKNKNYF